MPAAGRGAGLVRPAAARLPAARLGDAALQPASAAPRPGVRAARDAVSHPARRLRRRAGARAHRAGAPVPALVCGRLTFLLRRATRLDQDGFAPQLALAGYSTSTQVVAPGEVCFRGGLVDLFPMGSAVPYRLDLDDELIETDPHLRCRHRSARCTGSRKVTCCRRASSRSTTPPAPSSAAAGARSSRAIRPSGACTTTSQRRRRRGRRVLPAAVLRALATIFDYLPRDARVVLHGTCRLGARLLARGASSRFRCLRGDPDRPLLAPRPLFVARRELYVRWRAFRASDIPGCRRWSQSQTSR